MMPTSHSLPLLRPLASVISVISGTSVASVAILSALTLGATACSSGSADVTLSSTKLVEPGDAEPPLDAEPPPPDVGVDAGPRPAVHILNVSANGTGCSDLVVERDPWGGVRAVRFPSYRAALSAGQFATSANCTLAVKLAAPDDVAYTITPRWSGSASLSQRGMRVVVKTKSWWLGGVPGSDIADTATGPFGGGLSINASPQRSRCGERHDSRLVVQSSLDLRNGSPGGTGEAQIDGVGFTIEESDCPPPSK